MAKNSGGRTFLATPDATSGAFGIADLAPGSYTLSFTAASGYRPPADRTITIVAGQTAATGTIQVTVNNLSVTGGTISWTVNDQRYTTTVVSGTIERQGGTLVVEGKSISGNLTDAVTLRLSAQAASYTFAGAGTYKLSLGSYSRTTNGAGPVYNDRSTTSPLVVAQYDEATGTITGTFSYGGWDGDLGGNYLAVTNGTFSLRF